MRKMRDSGIDWIGTIPQDWEIVRTKSLYCSAKEIAGDRADDFERLALCIHNKVRWLDKIFFSSRRNMEHRYRQVFLLRGGKYGILT